MKLRSILGLLAIGVLTLPLALVVLARAFFGIGDQSETTIPRSFAAYQAFMEVLDLSDPSVLRAKAEKEVPEWMDLIVADRDGRIIYSDQPGTPPGSVAEEDTGFSAYLPPLSGYRTLIEGFTLNGKYAGSYALRYRTALISLSNDPAAPFVSLLLLLALAAVAITLSGIVSARIAGSFRKLEKAAQAIASGDLESAVPESRSKVKEIASLATAMESMRSAIKGDRSRRARFLAAISHDLRTPLTSIKGYLEAVEDGMAADAATMGRYVSIMRGKAALLEGRVNELLDFARMGTGEWRLRLTELDVGAFLGGLCSGYRQDAAAAGREFYFALDDISGLRLPADPKMLERALENVFQNALRYAPRGTAVYLESSRTGTAAEIAFIDSGPGIPAEDLTRIFDPYYRGKGSQGEGEGLGLSISRSILRDHGWEIRAASPPEGGSRFTISIPLPAD